MGNSDSRADGTAGPASDAGSPAPAPAPTLGDEAYPAPASMASLPEPTAPIFRPPLPLQQQQPQAPRTASVNDANDGIRAALRMRFNAETEVNATPIIRDILRLALTEAGIAAPKEGDRVPDAAAFETHATTKEEWLDWLEVVLSIVNRADLPDATRKVMYTADDLRAFVENTKGATAADFAGLPEWSPLSAQEADERIARWAERVKGWPEPAPNNSNSKLNKRDASARNRVVAFLQGAVVAAGRAAPQEGGGRKKKGAKRA